jgi:hypothetical protein
MDSFKDWATSSIEVKKSPTRSAAVRSHDSPEPMISGMDKPDYVLGGVLRCGDCGKPVKLALVACRLARNKRKQDALAWTLVSLILGKVGRGDQARVTGSMLCA